MKFNFPNIIFLSLLFLFVSCEANVDLNNISGDIVVNPSLVVPLGEANLNLSDLLIFYKDSGNIVTDGTEIYFQNDDTLDFNFTKLNFLSRLFPLSIILPINYPNNSIPANTSLPQININDNIDLGLNYTPEIELVDSVLIEEAVFSIIMNQTDVDISAKNVNTIITFPQIKMLNLGESNTINFIPVDYGKPTEITLKNFMLYTKGKSGFPVIIQSNLKTGANPVVLSNASNFQLKINITHMPYKVAYGYLEPFTKGTIVEQVVMNLNKNLPSGLLKYSNPQIEIKTYSNIGTYLRFHVDYVRANSVKNSNPIYAKFNGVDSTTVVFKTKPTFPGQWVNNDLPTLDKDWGETYKLFEFEKKPDILEYKFSISANKSFINNDKTANYLTPDGTLKVFVRTKIPFIFNPGSYLEKNDSVENIFETVSSMLNKYPQDKINTAELVLNISNGFPVGTKLSILLIDSLGMELKTDFIKEYSIKSGKADNNGIVQMGNETKQTLTISITHEQLNILLKARKIKYSVRIEAEDINTSKIHFNENNIFGIKFGFYVNGTLKTKLAI